MLNKLVSQIIAYAAVAAFYLLGGLAFAGMVLLFLAPDVVFEERSRAHEAKMDEEMFEEMENK